MPAARFGNWHMQGLDYALGTHESSLPVLTARHPSTSFRQRPPRACHQLSQPLVTTSHVRNISTDSPPYQTLNGELCE